MSAGPQNSTLLPPSSTSRIVESSTPVSRPVAFLIRECFDTGHLLAFQELQRRAAAGGNMRHLIGNFGAVNRRHCVAAADNRNRTDIFGHGVGDLESSTRKSRNLEYSHWPIPYNGP